MSRLPLLQSLRGRLLAVLLVTMAAGQVVAGIAIYQAEKDFLVSQVDRQIGAQLFPTVARLSSGHERHGPPADFSGGAATYTEVRDANSQVLTTSYIDSFN